MGERLLVMQLARMGDLVQTWPLLARLGAVLPDAEVHVLCDGRWADFMAWGPQVAATLPFDWPGGRGSAGWDLRRAYDQTAHDLARLRGEQFDRLLVLNYSRVALLLAHLLAKPVWGHRPVRGGRDFGRNAWLRVVFALVHARRFNRVHVSDVFRHLAPSPRREPPLLRPRAARSEPVVVLQLGTRHPRRTWPVGSFTRLAGLLLSRGAARVWLTGAREERPLGEELRRSLPPALRERVENLQGRTGLPALADHLEAADLVVSGDTGTLHLAAALGTRVLGLFFGPARCFETGPYGPGQVALQAEPPCQPCPEAAAACGGPGCAAMLTPELVARLAEGLLANGLIPAGVELPPQVRLYRSVADRFGSRMRPLGAALTLQDVVGEAYRRAGASLVGLEGVAWPQLPVGAGERLQVEQVLDCLTRGRPAPTFLASALQPLRAMAAHGSGVDDTDKGEETQAPVDEVARQFAAHLEQALGGWADVRRTGKGPAAGLPPGDGARGPAPTLAG